MKRHFFFPLFLALLGPGSAIGGTEHVWFPDWKVPRVSQAKLTDWDLSRAFRKKSGRRTEISLNGFWKFTLCEKIRETPPPLDAQWGYFLVPGFWRVGPQCNFIRSADGRAIEKFHGKNYNSYQQGWYYREFRTPPESADAQTLLKFDAFYSQGCVILNGKRVPLPVPERKVSSACPYFSVDVTNFLRPQGEMNAIYVATDAKPMRAGLQDNVWLAIRPKQHFGQIRISTFVKAKRMRIDFSGAGLPDNFSAELNLKIRDAKDGTTVCTARKPFAEKIELDFITPKLWSLDEPNLYYLDCELVQNGKTIDAAAVRFGFRELTAEKGALFLNGKPIMLNTESSWQGMWQPLWYASEQMTRKSIRAMKFLGINSAYGQNMMASSFYDVADEEGFIAVEKICLTFNEYQANNRDECLKMWRSLAKETIRSGRLDNHPSVAAILVDVYYGGSASGNNPAFVGLPKDAQKRHLIQPDGKTGIIRGGDPNLFGGQRERSIKLNAVADEAKKYFPDAEILTGSGGHVKNAYGIHIYHTWGAPFAELAALFQRYGMEREIALYCGEYALPYHGSFADLGLWGKIRGKPEYFYWQENGARILGPSAYRENTVTVPFAWDGPLNDLLASTRGRDGRNRSEEHYFLSGMFAKVLIHSIERTIFFWRYDGLSGLAPFEYFSGRYLTAARSLPASPRLDGDLTRPGVKPSYLPGSHILPLFTLSGDTLDLRPNPVTTPFRQAMSDVVCKFMGTGRDYYENDHAFWSGETLSKALGIINMSGKKLDYRIEVSLLDASGSSAASTEFAASLKAYDRKTIPFRLKMPAVGVRGEYTLKAIFRPGNPDSPALTTAQKVQVFPAVHPTSRKIQVYGAAPAFLATLKRMGYDALPIRSFREPVPDRVLVIAPGAFSNEKKLPDFSALAEKGIRSLIMEQRKNASPELMKIRSRQAFINAPAHPVLAGMTDADFADWRGSHSLDPAYGNPEPGHVWSSAQWVDWGNRGMVAGNVFRRPQTGNLLPLLVSGFDLYQTPLLEYRGKNGSWIGSQLEIGERLLLDPVATTVFCRMIDYLSAPRKNSGKTGFFGGEKGTALLKKFQVEYTKIDPADRKALNELKLLIISDPDWKKLEQCSFQLSEYVCSGGRILYLHSGKEWYGSWLPFLLEMKLSAKCEKALPRRTECDGAWLDGWSESELYWREKLQVPAFANLPPDAVSSDPAVLLRVKHGCGSYFFCSLTPEFFRNQKAAVGKCARLISALLTSHGATMKHSASPYLVDPGLSISLEFQRWEFALDPADKGLKEKWQNGKDGSGKWLSGQQTVIGEYVRPGIGYELFLEKEYSGVSWYRLKIRLSGEQAARKNMRLELGTVHTSDRTFLNGREIGSGNKRGARVYRIPDGLLKPGVNTLAIRIENTKRPGGLVYGKIQLINTSGKNRFWKLIYPEGGERDYYYNPDAIRQY